MTSRERFLTALSVEYPTEFLLTEHLFSLKLLNELLGYTTVLYDGKAQAKLATKLGIDAIWTPINGFCGIEETPHDRMKFIKMSGASLIRRTVGRSSHRSIRR